MERAPGGVPGKQLVGDGALQFKVIGKLYEHAIVVITTNLNFAEWASVFGDSKTVTAVLDRVRHLYHFLDRS